MNSIELLALARGTAFQVALMVFIIGMILRALEIFMLGRHQNLSVPRDSGTRAGFRTILTRSIPIKGTLVHRLPSYLWHIGFFVVLLFYAPHILLFKQGLGLHWPSLPNAIIEITSVVTLAAMMFTLFTRFTDPVRRMLATAGDYFAWLVTLLPVITGYMAFHHFGDDYTLMLAIHIMSVNLLLLVFPFTKLTHAMTLFFSRWYNGAEAGRKGVRT